MNTLRNYRDVIKMCKIDVCRKETEFSKKQDCSKNGFKKFRYVYYTIVT